MDNTVFTVEQITRLIQPIAAKYNLEKVYLFGSYARGEAGPASDIDLCVDTGELNGFFALGALYLSAQLTAEFGQGFSVANLRNMRQFYCCFPNRYTLCSDLSWSHYRLLMRVPDEKARAFYADECAKSAWSVRQLERQIHTMYYQRILASQDKVSVAAEIQATESVCRSLS